MKTSAIRGVMQGERSSPYSGAENLRAYQGVSRLCHLRSFGGGLSIQLIGAQVAFLVLLSTVAPTGLVATRTRNALCLLYRFVVGAGWTMNVCGALHAC